MRVIYRASSLCQDDIISVEEKMNNFRKKWDFHQGERIKALFDKANFSVQQIHDELRKDVSVKIHTVYSDFKRHYVDAERMSRYLEMLELSPADFFGNTEVEYYRELTREEQTKRLKMADTFTRNIEQLMEENERLKKQLGQYRKNITQKAPVAKDEGDNNGFDNVA